MKFQKDTRGPSNSWVELLGAKPLDPTKSFLDYPRPDEGWAASDFGITGYYIIEKSDEDAIKRVLTLLSLFEGQEISLSRTKLGARDMNRAIGAANAYKKMRLYIEECQTITASAKGGE